MRGAGTKDLILQVADKNQEYALYGLLKRTEELGIRPVTYECRVHPHHDPGCLRGASEILRPFLKQFRHAVVMLDHEGSGREQERPEDLEQQIEDHLGRNGWDDRACAVVISPELEIWVWNDLPAVERVLGWKDPRHPIRDWLADHGYWARDQLKPWDPKVAMEKVLRLLHKARSSAIYQEMARRASFQGCKDRAFRKLVTRLKIWFPASGLTPRSRVARGCARWRS